MLGLPTDIKRKIVTPLPTSIIKERDGGGGKMLSYASGSTIIDKLNAVFGYLWDWEAEKEWIEASTRFFNKYSKVPESEKVTHGSQRGSWEEQNPVAHVKGKLTVYYYDGSGTERKIVKSGYGSKSIIGKQSEQESAFKAAGTDALKKAASLLGIALELYRDEEEQQFFDELNYEDPWTDELQVKYKEEREYITALMENGTATEEVLSGLVAEFSENTLESLFDITPDNIVGYVDFLRIKFNSPKEEVKKTLKKIKT